MAFQFSRGNVVQPVDFGQMMDKGFVGPGQLLAAGVMPASQAIAQEKANRDQLMGLGMQEAASTKRTAMNNDAAKELARLNNKHSDDSGRRTAMQALALAPRMAGAAGGFAGQAFGIGAGAEGNAVQRMTQAQQDQNDLNDQLWRQRQNIARWGQGSAVLGANAMDRMPGQPAAFGT